MEIRRSYDRLISTMGFPILVRRDLYIESGPWLQYADVIFCTCWKRFPCKHTTGLNWPNAASIRPLLAQLWPIKACLFTKMSHEYHGVSNAGNFTVCSTVCSGVHQRKHQRSVILALYEGNQPVTNGFSSQRASNAENVSMSWCHHVQGWFEEDLVTTLVE